MNVLNITFNFFVNSVVGCMFICMLNLCLVFQATQQARRRVDSQKSTQEYTGRNSLYLCIPVHQEFPVNQGKPLKRVLLFSV